MSKTLTTLALATAVALAAAAPRPAAAHDYGGAVAAGIIGGLALGAIANSYYYGPRYYYGGYYGGGYYYGRPYYYAPRYYDAPYAYEPAPPVYVRPAPVYRGGGGNCWVETDRDRGYGYYRPCY